MKKLLLIIVILLLANTVSYGGDITGYIELLKSDMRTHKVAIITESLQLTAEEASAFWPVHREYEHELSGIIDDRIALINDYMQNHDKLTNEKAKEIAKRVFALEKRRTKLKKKYFKKFEKALSAIIAAKFIQVESQINLVADMQIAAEMPLIK
jgi:hypothetical protein